MFHIVSDFKYPKMYRVRQHLNSEKVGDIKEAVWNELDRIGIREKIDSGLRRFKRNQQHR